jgi:hypothetical protein
MNRSLVLIYEQGSSIEITSRSAIWFQHFVTGFSCTEITTQHTILEKLCVEVVKVENLVSFWFIRKTTNNFKLFLCTLECVRQRICRARHQPKEKMRSHVTA